MLEKTENNRKTGLYHYDLAVKAPLFKSLTYSSKEPLSLGQKVQVPLGRKQVSAVVLKESHADQGRIQMKSILDVQKEFTPLNPARLDWLKWLSAYYHYPLGMVMDLSFPPLAFKKKKEEPKAKPFAPVNKTLNEEQVQCQKEILKNSHFDVHLIYGVTGSGKTEIYKTLAEEILTRGEQVLVLLPEIFLTPQIVERFSEKFQDQVSVIHSQLTQRQKTQAWQEILFQEKNLLIGTRSALFCPLPKLAMIIVDEEHDSSFKQEDKLRYHARDSAIVLAQKLNIPIVLGSATPSLSSWHLAQTGRYKLHTLTQKAFKQAPPSISLVDLKEPEARKSSVQGQQKPFWLSSLLLNQIQKTLEQKKQVALFLNRRGVSTSLLCLSCGHFLKCPNCDITLTLHGQGHLLCHYCGYVEKKSKTCSACQGQKWLERGLGTEGIEQTMKNLFPQVGVIRADRDAIDSRQEMENFISIVEKQEAQIIIGTQMLSKGLDFPSIYLVGLVLADMGFHFPDFRATEKSFQTLTQMAGRAGRRSQGEVILQTFNPHHPSLVHFKTNDYACFAKSELDARKQLFYPPFCKLLLLEVESLREKEGEKVAFQLVPWIKKYVGAIQDFIILGPSPAPIYKLKNKYRFHILIKTTHSTLLTKLLKDFDQAFKTKPFVRIKVNRDPGFML